MYQVHKCFSEIKMYSSDITDSRKETSNMLVLSLQIEHTISFSRS